MDKFLYNGLPPSSLRQGFGGHLYLTTPRAVRTPLARGEPMLIIYGNKKPPGGGFLFG